MLTSYPTLVKPSGRWPLRAWALAPSKRLTRDGVLNTGTWGARLAFDTVTEDSPVRPGVMLVVEGEGLLVIDLGMGG